MEISDREKLVLGAVIDYYLNTGQVIGSRTLVKKYQIEYSSATIRNVMADLEDMGYIQKTHTSSGRIPTNKGYKYYLEQLIKIKKLSKQERNEIDYYYENRVDELDSVLERTSSLLSKISSYVGIAIEPELKSERIKRIELIYVNEYFILAVFIMGNSNVKTKKIYLEKPISQYETLKMKESLNARITGTFLLPYQVEEIIKKEREERLDELSKECFQNMEGGFFVEGAPNILKLIEKDSTENISELVKYFETKENLKTTILNLANKEEYLTGKVNIILGSDLKIKELEDFSIVFSIYNLGNSKGIVGIIGPKRMEYSKAIGLVEYVSEEVEKYIDKKNK